MSRPQFQTSSQVSPLQGQIVNGGLIDFQDNFHRGLSEYVQQCNNTGGVSSQVPGPGGYGMMGAGFMPQQSINFQQTGAGQLPCISGPPSFIHVNGVTYKPVEDAHSSAKATTGQAPDPPARVESEPRILTDEDIDRRVKDRVEVWASTQRKQPAGRVSRAQSDEERVAARVSSVNEGMRGRFRSPM